MNPECLWTASAPSGDHHPAADPVAWQKKKSYCFLVLSPRYATAGKVTTRNPSVVQPTVENSEMHLKAYNEQKKPHDIKAIV